MPTVPLKLSSFSAPQWHHTASSSVPPPRKPLHPLRSSANSQSAAHTADAAVLARRVHEWLSDASLPPEADVQTSLPSVTFLQSTLRNPHSAQLYNLLLHLQHCQPQRQTAATEQCKSATRPAPQLATEREQLTAALATTQQSIEQCEAELQREQCAIQQQHRQLKQRETEERERQRRMLLTQASLDKVARKLGRLRQWQHTTQARDEADGSRAPVLPHVVATSGEELQRLREPIDTAKRRSSPSSRTECVRSLRPLLIGLRRRHIEMAVETQRLLREAAECERKTAELPACPAATSTLPLLQRDIAAHRALLEYVERLQAGDGRAGLVEVRASLATASIDVDKLKGRVRERWAEMAALQQQRKQMRQARQPHIDELRVDHQQHVQPLLDSLSTALAEQHALMAAECEQLRDLPLSITHRVPVQTAAGTTSTFLLPASSSSLHAVAAPWPALRPVLDALPRPWYQSADSLLPQLVNQHLQHSDSHSSAAHHRQQLLSTLQNDSTLPAFASLLASSADLDATQASAVASLATLHASLSSLSQSATHLSQLLHAQLQYGSLQLLPALRVDGRDGREWMELLGGLEAQCERRQQRARERKEAQLREAQQRFGDAAGRAATVQAQQQHRYSEYNYSARASNK